MEYVQKFSTFSNCVIMAGIILGIIIVLTIIKSGSKKTILILIFSTFIVSGISLVVGNNIKSDFSSYIEEKVHLRLEKDPDLYSLSQGSIVSVNLIDDFGGNYEMKMLVFEGKLMFFSNTGTNGIWKRVIY